MISHNLNNFEFTSLYKFEQKTDYKDEYVNSEGDTCKRGTLVKNKFYCGKAKVIPGTNGYCGPRNGNNCEPCKEITKKYGT